MTASDELATKAATILTQFLPANASGLQYACPSTDAEIRSLMLVKQLYDVMKNVFTSSWLCSAATAILSGITKRDFTVETEDVRAAWNALSCDLVIDGSPNVLGLLSGEIGEGEVKRRRQLRAVFAKVWKDLENKVVWQDAVFLLGIPFRSVFPFSFSSLMVSLTDLSQYLDTFPRRTCIVGRSA